LEEQGIIEKPINIVEHVSQAWKELNEEEREKCNDLSRMDKLRFEVEKSLYSGPWKVLVRERNQKNPDTPERPMSAFLAYSHVNRDSVKAKDKDMNNIEISRVLVEMWKQASEEEKERYIKQAHKLRQIYCHKVTLLLEKKEKDLMEYYQEQNEIALQKVAEKEHVRHQIDTYQQHLSNNTSGQTVVRQQINSNGANSTRLRNRESTFQGDKSANYSNIE